MFKNRILGRSQKKQKTKTPPKYESRSLVVGNTSKQVSENAFDWEVFVRGSAADEAKSVHFRLHPTFSPSQITKSKPPFVLKRRGWGTFEVGVTINWKAHTGRKATKLTHKLDFSTDAPKPAVHMVEPAVRDVAAHENKKQQPVKTQDPHLRNCLAFLDKKLKNDTAWSGKRMENVPATEMHGRLGAERKWMAPRLVVFCDKEARPGYTSRLAHEYEDEPWVLREKVKVLAMLVAQSKRCCAYTGAGISTASGIDDYASKAKDSVAMKRKRVDGFLAEPTLAHRVLAALYRKGYLKHWVQQNHDGLPQKAGFPPEHLNEIHGAWFDPSNPVVPMSGSLRDDLCKWMYEWEKKTDLCLAMGTSLCGMNADRMAVTPAVKTKNSLGTVIVGLQQCQYDDICTLRFFAKIDEVMALLARELGLLTGACAVRKHAVYEPSIPKDAIKAHDRIGGRPTVLRVPYDKHGKLTQDRSKMVDWNLENGARVMVTAGPGKGYVGKVLGRTAQGHIRVRLPCQREGSNQQGRSWTVYILGQWWLETATKGTAPFLPLVNTQKPDILPNRRGCSSNLNEFNL